MRFKEGSGWKACHDESSGRYFGEYGGIMAYHLYELTEEQFDSLDETMTETGTIIFSDKIANLKLADSSGTYRTLKRTYAAGDAYICQDGSFMHVKAFCG